MNEQIINEFLGLSREFKNYNISEVIEYCDKDGYEYAFTFFLDIDYCYDPYLNEDGDINYDLAGIEGYGVKSAIATDEDGNEFEIPSEIIEKFNSML